VRLVSEYGEENGDALTFRFTGTVGLYGMGGNGMSGELDMGEYRRAQWTAIRHELV